MALAKQVLTDCRSWQGKLAIEVEAQKHAQTAINTLLDVMAITEWTDESGKFHRISSPDKDRIRAAETILAYAFGKPVERSVIATLGNDGQSLQSMSTRDLLARYLEVSAPNALNHKGNPVIEGEKAETTPGIDFEKG